MLLPLVAIISNLFLPDGTAWEHIKSYLLLQYFKESLLLLGGSLFFGVIIASALAWFITSYEFKGRKFLRWALIFPLAIPPYIAGYVYVFLTGYSGIIQIILRKYDIPISPAILKILDIQDLPGAIFIFTLFLYPYIYIVLCAFLDRQAGEMMEAAQMLGASRRRAYWKIILPLTRNSVIGGATLMAFEILSDYGVTQYFGLQVFTTAIFKSWSSFYDISSAMRLSAILLLIVTFISITEKSLRGRKTSEYRGKYTPFRRQPLSGLGKVLVPLFCWIIFGLGVVIPLAQLGYWAVISLGNIRLSGLLEDTLTSFGIAALGAVITTFLAFVIVQNQRLWPSLYSRSLARLTVMGYSIPATVIAFSIFSTVLGVAKFLGIDFQVTWQFIILAFVIRYLAVSMQSIEAGFDRLGTRYHESARLLGRGPIFSSVFIDLPMMKLAVLGAFLLAFLDMVKELTMVLILRPFNFSTLSIRVFEYAHDEAIPESALASLLIIGLALIPIIMISFPKIYQKHSFAELEKARAK